MVYFCLHCYNEIPPDATLCPFCGNDTTFYDTKTFEDKLIHALTHPLPETVSIAITVLGKIKSKKAVKPLMALFRNTSDPYIQKEILNALFAIGTKASKKFIHAMCEHHNIIVKKGAEVLVKQMKYAL